MIIFSNEGKTEFASETEALSAGWGTIPQRWPEMRDQRLPKMIAGALAGVLLNYDDDSTLFETAVRFGDAVKEYLRLFGQRELGPAPSAYGVKMEDGKAHLIIKRKASS